MRVCYICQRDRDLVVDDGLHGLCDECARKESNRIYNNMLRVFEEEEELYRKAFATYGADDLLYAIDEERE